jgi:hypothetical protein
MIDVINADEETDYALPIPEHIVTPCQHITLSLFIANPPSTWNYFTVQATSLIT